MCQALLYEHSSRQATPHFFPSAAHPRGPGVVSLPRTSTGQTGDIFAVPSSDVIRETTFLSPVLRSRATLVESSTSFGAFPSAQKTKQKPKRKRRKGCRNVFRAPHCTANLPLQYPERRNTKPLQAHGFALPEPIEQTKENSPPASA